MENTFAVSYSLSYGILFIKIQHENNKPIFQNEFQIVLNTTLYDFLRIIDRWESLQINKSCNMNHSTIHSFYVQPFLPYI